MAPKPGAAKKAAKKTYDYSGLEKGMRLQVESDGAYYAAEIVQVSESKSRARAPVKVSYQGYDGYDEWVGGDRMRSRALKVVEAERKEAPRPEPTVSVGIMSTSEIVDKVLPSLKKFCKVVGVASRDKERAAEFCKKRDCGEGMTNEEMVERSDIDFVYNPLPSGVRNQWSHKLIASGKHIYAEKPMAGDVKEMEALLAACEGKALQWMDGTMWYHSHRSQEIEEKLRSGAIGRTQRVTASFTFSAPNEEWLHGGNGRTDKTREPMGCLGDQGWYPLSAVLFGFRWELPEKVMATHTRLNKVDTIISCCATLWFSDGRSAVIDCGATAPHRSQYEIVGETGTIRVDDLVGGQGRSGNFDAYGKPFVGSGLYYQSDAAGKEKRVRAKKCDHVDKLVLDFVKCVEAIKAGGAPDPEWPKRSLAVHKVLDAIFESSSNGGREVRL